MFHWNWEWRAKADGQDRFLMRMPNKIKLDELCNFDEFKLKGTSALIMVEAWEPEITANGKLNAVVVRVRGLPDSLKHYMGICEVGSILGPVIDVDMEDLKAKDVIRTKMGIRDPAKLPIQTEIVTRDLLMYDLFFSLEKVLEEGWQNNLRAANTRPDDNGDSRVLKKQRYGSSIREVIQLGSPSLAQFESDRGNGGGDSANRCDTPLLLGEESSIDGAALIVQPNNMQLVEEELSRKATLVEEEKRALNELAIEKAKMEEEIQKHKTQLEYTNRKLQEVQKLLEILKNYGYQVPNSQEVDEEEEQVDYTSSQDKVVVTDGDSQDPVLNKDGSLEDVDPAGGGSKDDVPNPRRCGRLRNKELKKVEELAIERANAKDNPGKEKGTKAKPTSVGHKAGGADS